MKIILTFHFLYLVNDKQYITALCVLRDVQAIWIITKRTEQGTHSNKGQQTRLITAVDANQNQKVLFLPL